MVELLKIRDVKDPVRDFGNAGIDFFVPNKSEKFVSDLLAKNPNLKCDEEGFYVSPHEGVNIPSGIKSKFSANIALEAHNKSGVAMKKLLVFGASTIDSSYQGEIHCHMINVGNTEQYIKYGEKIVQFIPRLIDIDEHKVHSSMSEEKFFEGIVTTRGSGAFGSTGSF
jgi:dUTPase